MCVLNKRTLSNFAVSSRLWVTAFLLLLLSGCATTPKEEVAVSEQQKEQLWSENEKKLIEFKRWRLEGRLGIRVPGESGSMSIEWLQKEADYTIYLDGPLGQSLAKIAGNQHSVTVEASGEKYFGLTPEALLFNITGWDLPISALKYWIMGLPVPEVSSTLKLNNQGYPQELYQQGWKVEYLGYKPFDGLMLPARMKVQQGEVSATLLIRGRHAN